MVTCLSPLDLAIIAVYLGLIIAIGLGLMRNASQSVERFFVAGRTMPWWLMGITMAATNFSIDTPIAFTEIVYKEGLIGLWYVWCGTIGGMMVTFVFSKLWKRSGVMTDVSLIAIRYSGKSARVLRVFKGLYFGLLFNVFVMGWVCLAMLKVTTAFTTLDARVVLGIAMLVVLVTTTASGLYGTALASLLRWSVALIGALITAGYAVMHVGGLSAMRDEIISGPAITSRHLDLLPTFDSTGPLPLSALLTYLLVQWWANKYSDGAGKHIVCMLACRTERDSVQASLLYTVLIQVIHLWPWVIAALCGIVILGGPDRMSPSMAYPELMKKILPSGLLGFVCASLIGAFISTMSLHLTLASSYVVNDLYRPLLRKEGSARHYMFISRVAMVILLLMSGTLALNMTTVAGAWRFLLTFTAGAGLVWILRWFWWRINAWSEFSAMLASGLSAIILEHLVPQWFFTERLILTVLFSTVVWLAVTLCTPATETATLIGFIRRIRPVAVGWRRIYRVAGIAADQSLTRDIGHALLGFAALTCASFAAAHLLTQNVIFGLLLLGGCIILLILLLVSIRRKENHSLSLHWDNRNIATAGNDTAEVVARD